MIRERQVKGPVSTVTHNGKEHRIEYRRRYYETGVHFTWVEIELARHDWTECGDAWQTGFGSRAAGRNMTAAEVRKMVCQHLDTLATRQAEINKQLEELRNV